MTRQEQTRPPRLTTFDGLHGLADRLTGLDQAFAEIGQSPEKALAQQARDQRGRIRAFEASVTMIGQVKAGKTTLVNAMVGWPDLLPADVNPWTSVVTSLHLSPHLQDHDRRAAFRFFTDEEWDHLIRQGGRVGQMAARAGAEDEMEKVRAQLDAMREKSRARLGRKFHMLLGQTHEYEHFDEELIKRYVCLGDDFWDEADGSRAQGRFADITRSADLWLPSPDLPLGLCIRDTPGVNDTFMIREQITINALRGSRLCVVVLSAAQALSSVDLGLIRLISNVRAREVIIFVNRIDELPDPARSVPEIRNSILATLARFDGPEKAEILFGSGHWANHAASGSFDALGEDSGRALVSWAEAHVDSVLARLSPEQIIWHLSGVPALGQAICERVEEHAGARLEEGLHVTLGNLQTGARTHETLRAPAAPEVRQVHMSATEILQNLEQIEDRASAALEARLAKAQEVFAARTGNAQRAFLGRATGSLIKHLEQFGEGEVWTYDPSGLRMLLRSAYKVFVQGAGKAGTDVFQTAASDIDALYRHAFGLSPEVRSIAPPPLPTALAPVNLGQTIALDLRGGWWTRFWRRQRGYEAFSEDFARLIHEETQPVVDTLHRQSATPFTNSLSTALAEFIAGQRQIILGLANHASTSAPAHSSQTRTNLRHAV